MTKLTTNNEIRHELVPTRAALDLAVRRAQEAIDAIDKLLKEIDNDKDREET